MFSKRCLRCDRKVSKDFDFCPFCGQDFRLNKKARREEDYGLLGRDDLFESRMPDMKMGLPLGFNNLFNTLLKEVDQQFKNLDKEMTSQASQKQKNIDMNGSGISISISTATGKKPEIKVNAFGPEFKDMKIQQAKEVKLEMQDISEEKAKAISKLPKKEAETKVRRLSNKIVYEIDLPGVKNIRDVVLNKLENSTEIKAFSKDKAYFKLLPVNFPLTNYSLKNEKLILEFRS
ncbi:MAG: zinc ribbon domain-containing protein [Nanoarchaeota archaeon]|nr:zinc ribbon domain-containing protein [Nanoarchaeota archaeon]